MTTKNIVFIARSLDGYIAGKNGELDWLHAIPNPDQVDMGYHQLMVEVDAVIMGRTTYETVMGFGGEWPYTKHVFVLSSTLEKLPTVLAGKVTILSGSTNEVLSEVHELGYYSLYIDGGRTVQNFIKDGLIDELRITTMPILLGGGFSLFGELPKPVKLEHLSSKLYLGQVVQDWYKVVK